MLERLVRLKADNELAYSLPFNLLSLAVGRRRASYEMLAEQCEIELGLLALKPLRGFQSSVLAGICGDVAPKVSSSREFASAVGLSYIGEVSVVIWRGAVGIA